MAMEGWIQSKSERVQEELEGFDSDPRFGPCKGIGRLQRWKNASNLGLDPPDEIQRVVKESGLNDSYLDKYMI